MSLEKRKGKDHPGKANSATNSKKNRAKALSARAHVRCLLMPSSLQQVDEPWLPSACTLPGESHRPKPYTSDSNR